MRPRLYYLKQKKTQPIFYFIIDSFKLTLKSLILLDDIKEISNVQLTDDVQTIAVYDQRFRKFCVKLPVATNDLDTRYSDYT